MDRPLRKNGLALVALLLRFQWRAYWRGLSRGGKLTVGNQGLSLIIVGIVGFKYVQSLRLAAIDLTGGKTTLLESLLAGIWVAWTITTNSSREQRSVAARAWLHLPLSQTKLFTVRILSLLITPSAWLVLAGSLGIGYPLAHSPHPLAGILAALLFVIMTAFVGLTFAHLLSIPVWRRVLVACALVLLAGAVVYLVNYKPHDGLGPGTLFPLTPMALVANAALGKQARLGIPLVASLTFLSGVTAIWSFRAGLAGAAPRSSARNRRPARLRLPGQLGGLVAKDLRYFWRLLDTYLGLLAAAAGCFYLVTAEFPTLDIFLILLTLVFIPIAPLAFNSFGLDSPPGLDRYAIWPISGRAIMLSKNLAFLCVVGLQTCALILLACARVGTPAGVIGLVAFTSLAAAALAWGNWMSLSQPKKMLFFHFSSSSSSIFDTMAGVAFLSLPGVLIIYLVHSRYYSALNLLLVMIFFGATYLFSLAVFGPRFDQKRERIARVLS